MPQSGRHFWITARNVLAEIFERRAAEEPITHVDLVDDQARLEDERVWDHRIVRGVSVLGDVEVLLHDPTGIGKERPVGADSAAKLVSFSDVVGADGDETAVA